MSWDILIQDLPDVARVEDIPDDFRPGPIASRAAVVAAVLTAAPTTDFRDPEAGHFVGDGFTVTFSIGDDDPVSSVMVMVHGSGDAAVDIVDHLLSALGRRALDHGNGEFFDRQTARESFRSWQAYRDQVLFSGPGQRDGSERRRVGPRWFDRLRRR